MAAYDSHVGPRITVRVPIIAAIFAFVVGLIAALIPSIMTYSSQRQRAVEDSERAIVSAADSVRDNVRSWIAEKSSNVGCLSGDTGFEAEIGKALEPPPPTPAKAESGSEDSGKRSRRRRRRRRRRRNKNKAKKQAEAEGETKAAKAGEKAPEKAGGEADKQAKAPENPAKVAVEKRLKAFCDAHKSCKRAFVAAKNSAILFSTQESDNGSSLGGSLINNAISAPGSVSMVGQALKTQFEAQSVVASAFPGKEYVLLAAFNMDKLFKRLGESGSNLGKTGRVIITDGRRMPVYGWAEGKQDKAIEIEPIVQALRGESGFLTTPDDMDKLVQAAFRPVGEAGVALVVTQHVEEIENSGASFSMGGLIGALIFALLGAIAVFFITRKFLDPINVLLQSANRVASGDLAERVPVLTEDEFGAISKIWNDVVTELQRARGGAVPQQQPQQQQHPDPYGDPYVGGGGNFPPP